MNFPLSRADLQQIREKISHSPAQQVFLWFMAADAALFFSFLAAFYLNHSQEPDLMPLGHWPVWPLPWLILNGGLLGASLLFLLRAFQAIFGPQERPHTSHWLNLSIWSGGLFALLQGAEWLQIGWEWSHSRVTVAACFFYLLISGYALHLLAGLIALKAVQRNLVLNTWMLHPFSDAQIILGQTHLALVGTCWSALLLLWPLVHCLRYFS